MGLLRLATLGALGTVAYRVWKKFQDQSHAAPAAFASSHGSAPEASPVRDAGPEAMRDAPLETWSTEDQQSDESFPASDPPGNY